MQQAVVESAEDFDLAIPASTRGNDDVHDAVEIHIGGSDPRAKAILRREWNDRVHELASCSVEGLDHCLAAIASDDQICVAVAVEVGRGNEHAATILRS